MSVSTTALFCCLADFAETFEEWARHRLIPTQRKRRRAGKLSLGEMLFIMVLFQLSPFKDFKHFRLHGVEQEYRDRFGDLPSYGKWLGSAVERPTRSAMLERSRSTPSRAKIWLRR